MTTVQNRERGLDVEDIACDRYPVARVDDDVAEWHDLEFVEDLESDTAGVVIVAGTPTEAKSCYEAYDGGRRAGRWWIRRANHERLLAADGEYVLAVLDREDGSVLRMGIVPAHAIEAIVDGDWWHCGDGGRSAEEYRQIAWTAVFEDLGGPHGGDGA